MKAVMPSVPAHVLQWRKQTGADMWDEMWEGVLHMPPMPSRTHQDLQWRLEAWLRRYWAEPGGNRVYHEIHLAPVGGWPRDYRIPDLVLLTPDRFQIDHDDYFEGAPTVVVEIRSPDDETYDKLPFYARLGVPEVWVIDRDSRSPEIRLLAGGEYDRGAADPDGWLRSGITGVQMRPAGGSRLELRRGDDPSTRQLLPEGSPGQLPA